MTMIKRLQTIALKKLWRIRRKVKPLKIIAVQDRNHHNKPILATNVTKIFFLCKEISGEFTPNDETDACEYFALDNLPKLSLDRNTKEQIAMCFDAWLGYSIWIRIVKLRVKIKDVLTLTKENAGIDAVLECVDIVSVITPDNE